MLRNLKTRTALIAFAGLIVIGAAILNGCHTAPVTGRRQLLTVSATEEQELGLTAYQQILQEETAVNNEAIELSLIHI